MTKWEVIDLAPRDGTRVDLWVKHIYARGNHDPVEYRVADAFWRRHNYDEHGGWVVSDYNGDISGYVEHDIFGGCVVATHWTKALERP